MSKRREPPIEELLVPGMIDSHFHSEIMRKKGLDPEKILSETIAAGLAGGIEIGVHAGDTAERAWVTQTLPQIKLAAGLAPAEAEHEDIRGRLEFLEKDLQSFPVDALGEIGVDGHWNYGTPERQKELFALQIELANSCKLPIIVHNRDADTQLLDVLEQHKPLYGGIMHCFSSGYETALRCIDAGLFISFAGNISYKNSGELRAVAARIPREALLAETDSPFLSPEPLRGKPNHPGKVAYVYRLLADVRSMELEKLVDTIGNNFERLFSRERVHPDTTQGYINPR
ncbi:MAG: TatD family hydrolase [Spirochaetia bacterium]